MCVCTPHAVHSTHSQSFPWTQSLPFSAETLTCSVQSIGSIGKHQQLNRCSTISESSCTVLQHMKNHQYDKKNNIFWQRRTFLLFGFVLWGLLFTAATAAVWTLRDGDAVDAAVLEITVDIRLVLLALCTLENKPKISTCVDKNKQAASAHSWV